MGTGLIVVLAVVYVAVFLTLGLTAIRKGHWLWFIVGIVVPVFWLIGALLPPKGEAELS
jgi:ABC-type multidrug transport system permease subunit